jgi:ABC-type multidrug transport system permease subunit
VRGDRLTLGIMHGSPILVIGMFATLFRPGAFSPTAPSPTAALMVTYWMAFAAFFFGLTYGLLQICTEHPIVRRERFVGLRVGAYLLSKVAVLLPVLLAVDVAMVAVLRALDRLPAMGTRASVTLVAALLVDSIAALALGLLASAAVGEPSQATLMLPMLCFPAVLFSGAILPVPQMAFVGRAISAVTPARWSFESVGRALDLRQRAAGPDTGVLRQYGDAFTGGTTGHWVILAAFGLAFLAAAHAVVDRRSRGGLGRPR